MLWASQFVDVLLSRFSGPKIICPLRLCPEVSSTIPVPRVFPVPALVPHKSVSTPHVEKLADRLDVMGGGKISDSWGRAAAL